MCSLVEIKLIEIDFLQTYIKFKQMNPISVDSSENFTIDPGFVVSTVCQQTYDNSVNIFYICRELFKMSHFDANNLQTA